MHGLGHTLLESLDAKDSWFSDTLVSVLDWISDLLNGQINNVSNGFKTKHSFFVQCFSRFALYLFIYYLIIRILKAIRKHAYFISVPFDAGVPEWIVTYSRILHLLPIRKPVIVDSSCHFKS